MTAANLDVFVNCPFDDAYHDLFNAIVFTVIRCGFRARCGLEADNGGENRFEKICKIISECRFGVHDLSRTECAGDPPLPRFNMPLELGLFLGAQRYGAKKNHSKSCLIFDRDKFRYQQFISDIAGQDIHAHSDDVSKVITKLSGWLRAQEPDLVISGGAAIYKEFAEFNSQLPRIYAARDLRAEEVTFSDYATIVSQYVKDDVSRRK